MKFILSFIIFITYPALAEFKLNFAPCERQLVDEWLGIARENHKKLINKFVENNPNEVITPDELDHLIHFTVEVARKNGRPNYSYTKRVSKASKDPIDKILFQLQQRAGSSEKVLISHLSIRDFYLHHANRLNDDAYKKIITATRPRKYIDEMLTKQQGWKKEETEALNIYKGIRDNDHVIIAKEGRISPTELTKISKLLANGKVYFDELGEIYYASESKNINELIERWRFMNNKVIEDPEFNRILFCKDSSGKCLQVKFSTDPKDYEKPFSPKEKDNIWYYLYKKMDGNITEF